MREAIKPLTTVDMGDHVTEMYAIMNALVGYYNEVGAKHKVDILKLYADMAKAWLHDETAVPGKAATYYDC